MIFSKQIKKEIFFLGNLAFRKPIENFPKVRAKTLGLQVLYILKTFKL